MCVCVCEAINTGDKDIAARLFAQRTDQKVDARILVARGHAHSQQRGFVEHGSERWRSVVSLRAWGSEYPFVCLVASAERSTGQAPSRRSPRNTKKNHGQCDHPHTKPLHKHLFRAQRARQDPAAKKPHPTAPLPRGLLKHALPAVVSSEQPLPSELHDRFRRPNFCQMRWGVSLVVR